MVATMPIRLAQVVWNLPDSDAPARFCTSPSRSASPPGGDLQYAVEIHPRPEPKVDLEHELEPVSAG